MGLKKKGQHVTSRCCIDQTGILIMSHRKNTNVNNTVKRQPLRHFQTAVAGDTGKWAADTLAGSISYYIVSREDVAINIYLKKNVCPLTQKFHF